MNRIYQTPAILLQLRECGGFDRIGVFYTQAYGKQSILLKGIKKPTSKLQYKLQQRALLDIEFVLGRSLHRLTAVEDRDSYLDFLDDFSQLSLQALVCELLLHTTEDNHPDPELFLVSITALALVREYGKDQPYFVLSWIIIRWMAVLGLGINLSECVLTGKKKAKQFGVSVRSGGLIDLGVKPLPDDTVPIQLEHIAVLRAWQKGEINHASVPRDLIRYYIKWYQVPIQSLDLLSYTKKFQ